MRYKYWKKTNKYTWTHIPSGQMVRITDKSLDEGNDYQLDWVTEDMCDYTNIGMFGSFLFATMIASRLVRESDEIKPPLEIQDDDDLHPGMIKGTLFEQETGSDNY